MMVACIVAAVDKYQDLLRISVANAGNDHRLGGNEAPPAILSIFLGQKITNIFEEMVANKKDKKSTDAKKLSVLYISDFEQDDADRNRTSPFAFTGNKFEFRMLGSSFNISNSNIALNTAVAEIMKTVCDQLEQYRGDDKQSMIEKIIADLYQQHSRIVFNGNNYSDE
jgi:glutamine synthetase